MDVRLPRAWLARVETLAQAEGHTVSHWLREAVRERILRAEMERAGAVSP